MDSTLKASFALAPTAAFLLAACASAVSPEPSRGAAAAPRRVEAIPVVVAPVSRELEAAGAVAPWREVVLSSEVGGRVRRVHAREGDTVAAGAVLFELEDDARRAMVEAGQARAEAALRDRDRTAQLATEGSASAAALDQAQLALATARAELALARRALQESTLRAPFAGTLVDRPPERGALLPPGAPVATLLDLERCRALVAVGERALGEIAPGVEVRVISDAQPEAAWTGRVRRVGLRADAARAFTVEIELANHGPVRLRVGQTVRATFTLPAHDRRLVPRAAVTQDPTDPQRSALWLVEGEGARARVRRLPVEVGEEFGVRVALRSPVPPGARVVVPGNVGLDEGEAVEVVTRSPGGAP
jgi:RND family efflux transporter MFP subunit